MKFPKQIIAHNRIIEGMSQFLIIQYRRHAQYVGV